MANTGEASAAIHRPTITSPTLDKIDGLAAAPGDARFKGDQHAQRAISFLTRVQRLLFMRLHQGRYLVSKRKVLFALVCATAGGFTAQYALLYFQTPRTRLAVQAADSVGRADAAQSVISPNASALDQRPDISPRRVAAPGSNPPQSTTASPAAVSASVPRAKSPVVRRPAPALVASAPVTVRPSAAPAYEAYVPMASPQPPVVAPVGESLNRSSGSSDRAPRREIGRAARGVLPIRPRSDSGPSVVEAPTSQPADDAFFSSLGSAPAAGAQGGSAALAAAADTGEVSPLFSTDTSNARDGGREAAVQPLFAGGPVGPGTQGGVAQVGVAAAPVVALGEVMEAQLVVGVTVLSGRESAALLKLADGRLAIGKASLDSSKRVRIALTQLQGAEGTATVNGMVIGDDGFEGVTGAARDVGPDAATQLWQGSLRGVSGYVKGLANQASTTFGSGTVTVSNIAPSFGWSLIGGLVNTFAPPSPEPTVTVVELAPGASVRVIFLP